MKQNYIGNKNTYINMFGGTLKNAAILLFVKGRVLMVQNKNGEWMLPGGQIDKGETPWVAASREFREETGQKLPDLRKEGNSFVPYDYTGKPNNPPHTRIYYGETQIDLAEFDIDDTKTNETIDMDYIPLTSILDKTITVPRYVFSSLLQMTQSDDQNLQSFLQRQWKINKDNRK